MTSSQGDAPVTVAPVAPGGIGQAPQPFAIREYLDGLDAWVRGRRLELDELDAAALGAGRGRETSADVALSLALWKAVSDRYRQMVAVFDGGRVLGPERERIAALIWGRLDADAGLAGGSGMAVTVPEACKLSDALAAQLRTKLALSPGADRAAARIKDLRAQCERIRDQVGLEPATARDEHVERLAGLMARLEDVAARAGRGADVGGLLGPLEQEAAVFERDLIVGNARRRGAREQAEQARTQLRELTARAEALRDLAARCVTTVEPAPRYAVPDLAVLGPVPDGPEEIGAYRERLGRVGQALTLAHDAYAAALAEHTDLAALLDAYAAKARALGVADRDDLASSEARAREVLARRPAPMAVCRALVTAYQTWLGQLTPATKDAP
jgi:hypothetical protein